MTRIVGHFSGCSGELFSIAIAIAIATSMLLLVLLLLLLLLPCATFAA